MTKPAVCGNCQDAFIGEVINVCLGCKSPRYYEGVSEDDSCEFYNPSIYTEEEAECLSAI